MIELRNIAVMYSKKNVGLQPPWCGEGYVLP